MSSQYRSVARHSEDSICNVDGYSSDDREDEKEEKSIIKSVANDNSFVNTSLCRQVQLNY